MTLGSDKEEYVVHPKEKNLRESNVPHVSMFSQNTTNTTGSFQEANCFSYVPFVFHF